ncbi:MAG: hypothetical protein Fur0022_15900 [Anaerolineales bacterium]
MQKNRKSSFAFRDIIFLAITSIFIAITACKTKTDLSSIPVALVNLRGATLEFSCVNVDECFADIDLTQQISELNTSDAPLRINSAYYIDSSLLYIFLGRSGGEFLLKINPKTGDTKILDISEMMPLIAIRPVHGRLVIAWTKGTVGIIQDDFTMKKVELGKGIYHFTESEHESLLAYGEPFYQDGKMWASIFMVNVNTGDFEEKIFEGPEAEQSGSGQAIETGQKYIFGSILNVSSDLNYMYYLYQVGKDQQTVTSLTLAKFDLLTH